MFLKHLLPAEGRFYKANLHCHSTISDGSLSVNELKAAYIRQGYSVVAFTDHDIYADHTNDCDGNFIAITSYEADISDWSDPDGHSRRCYHFNCYDKNPSVRGKSLLPKPKYDNIEGINEYIRLLNEDGYLVCYNHPNWSQQNMEDYKDLKGLFACEIYNYSAHLDGIDGNQEVPYDTLLRRGNRLFCVAADDNHDREPFGHPLNDSFGGFVMIKAEKLTYKAVMEALERGDFYASMGPEIKELYAQDDIVTVKCSPVRRITFTTNARTSKCVMAEKDGFITEAQFKIEPKYGYVRIQIEDREGLRANSNAYFVEDILK
ncbi:MAG: PHP domain-containing protein [Clostridiales bacterium]|nr:PHP domain-containing protein [Clostridiales bacterium]